MAGIDMCIPYMRRLAERRTDRIIETSPNGIVILDEHLAILSMNDSFKTLFMCSESVCGKRISYLMDPEPFDILAAGNLDRTEMTIEHTNYNLICHQIIYALREEKQYVGIFVNMTNSMKNKKQLDEIRAKTVIQARNLLNHQISIAGQIAQFLGESTAENEKLLENLMQLGQEKLNKNNDNNKPWTKTYT
jgi:transcriptional regulator with PAS, ATPase and Fis domain